MNKFDQTILEYTGNLPTINPEEVAKRLAPALKAAPQVAKVMSGIGGAIDDASQKNPEEAMLIDKLKDPNTQISLDDWNKIEKILSDRGFKATEQSQKPKEEEEEKEESETSQTQPYKKETQSVGSSTSYGGQLQGI